MDPIVPPNLPVNVSIDSAASALGRFNAVNASAILELNQRYTLHILATVISSMSLTAAVCAVFWFFMMKRNFRLNLILLLILSGIWKSWWIFLYSVVTFARGPITTESKFCQVGGYFLQTGFEACDRSRILFSSQKVAEMFEDAAIFLMSAHLYYQIFPASGSSPGHDGLYRIRKAVFAAWIVFPNLSAGLAFINPRAAFMAQGAFCTIPLRPFWNRLGLFWGPRYLIWLYIVFVAVRIYRYVSSEFKVFGEERADTPSMVMLGESTKAEMSSTMRRPLKPEAAGEEAASYAASVNLSVPALLADPFLSATDTKSSRPPSDITSLSLAASPAITTARLRRSSHQQGPDISTEDFAPSDLSNQRAPGVSASTRRPSAPYSDAEPAALSPIQESGISSDQLAVMTPVSATQAMRQRRRAILRKSRLLFVYPVLYWCFWLIPFCVNIMNYTNYFAKNPVYALQISQLFMLIIMTLVDVVVFCWRETPWRHIPGSDGTFVGSFQ